MIKLLLLTNGIPNYRVAVYEELSKYFDLTIGYFDELEANISCKLIRFKKSDFFGMTFLNTNIYNVAKKYDSILVMGHLRIPQYNLLLFFKNRRFSLTYWGMDVSCSYTKKYDADRRLDFLRFLLMRRAESVVFYSKYPVSRYVSDGKFSIEKLFVANNTVKVDSNLVKSNEVRSQFLFIGTLYMEKGIFLLLNAYERLASRLLHLPKLVIIGKGPLEMDIRNWVSKHDFEDYIILKGPIHNERSLSDEFAKSLACISPTQAGLSVLNSLGHGVPFITSRDAYTAGERFNIVDGYNGFLFDGSVESLSRIMEEIANNLDFVMQLSANARDSYLKHASFNGMIESLKDAVNFGYEIFKSNNINKNKNHDKLSIL